MPRDLTLPLVELGLVLRIEPLAPNTPMLARRLEYAARAFPCASCRAPMDTATVTFGTSNDPRFISCVTLSCSKHPRKAPHAPL